MQHIRHVVGCGSPKTTMSDNDQSSDKSVYYQSGATTHIPQSFSRLYPFHMKGNSYTSYRYSCILFNPSCSQMRQLNKYGIT